jgi:hypothetical protein
MSVALTMSISAGDHLAAGLVLSRCSASSDPRSATSGWIPSMREGSFSLLRSRLAGVLVLISFSRCGQGDEPLVGFGEAEINHADAPGGRAGRQTPAAPSRTERERALRRTTAPAGGP